MKNCEDLTDGAGKTAPGVNPSGISARTDVPACFRRLEWDEVVTRGDFVGDELQGFELWEGPTGFRADAFVKPIYRRDETPSATAKKPK
jgi:hypothetical protein